MSSKELSQGGLAERLNAAIDSLHDSTVSGDPFVWSDSAERLAENRRVASETEAALRDYRHKEKTGAILKILGFGCGLPAATAGGMFLQNVPHDTPPSMWIYVGLGAIVLVSAIVAGCIGYNPSIDEDFALAAYTAPRGWSFSRLNGEAAWKKLVRHYPYFDKGDEDQEITLRIWGFMDEARTRRFMMFRFYYETVTYVPVKVDKTTVMKKVETPHWRYGLFMQVPESKVRFRMTEIGGDAGLDSCVRFEYGALNDAVDVWCDHADELVVRKFLSPAVLEIAKKLSDDLSDMLIDFYPGYAMLVSENAFLDDFTNVTLDETAAGFAEKIKPGIDVAEEFRSYVEGQFGQLRKYND